MISADERYTKEQAPVLERTMESIARPVTWDEWPEAAAKVFLGFRSAVGEGMAIVQAYSEWLSASDLPKLFINAEPGAILTGPQREFCRNWPNQEEVTVQGSHFIQEDSPDEIGTAIANFVKRIRG